ncbi:DNA-binding protein [Pelistega ratti]|uniref:DNA-binding protein n=1 Tax=Pelistega ratti TaxID=2652177 RepID=UPI001358798A|nr:DNA-binding protein [Pelistega ratti]
MELELKRKPAFEAALRGALSHPEQKGAILTATNWHESMISKVLAGDAGITLDKLDKTLAALGLVVVSRKYMEYLAYGNEIGTNCACARAGFNACGVK